MSKNARTILFFVLVIIFLIVTPIIIFYSEGYRFDFETKKVIETGGIFIRTYPGEANILINDRKERSTSNLAKNVLIQNLIPKKYSVNISKQGYLPWEKNIEITEKKVTEVDIVLFKDNYDKNVLNNDVLNIFEIEDGFILKKETGFYYYNPENKKEDLITENIIWDNVLVLKNDLLTQKEKKYYLINSTGIKEFNNIGQINFKKDKLNNIYYQVEDRLYKNNELIKTNIDLYELNNNTLYYFRDDCLYRDDARLISDKFIIKDKNYELLFIYNKVFLNENNKNLYILDDNEFKKIINLNNYFEHSEWDGKILINTGNEIWVYFAKETYYPEFTNQNTLKLIARFQNPIKDLYFINDKYYIFIKEKKLMVSEFDYRDKINIFTIANNLEEDSQAFFNYDNKNIYIFKDNILYSIDKIIP